MIGMNIRREDTLNSEYKKPFWLEMNNCRSFVHNLEVILLWISLCYALTRCMISERWQDPFFFITIQSALQVLPVKLTYCFNALLDLKLF